MIMLLSTTGTSARFSRSVGRALLAGAEAVRTLLKRRRTYGSLSALDDRMLHDIGLHRSMLLGVALHGVKSAREAAPLAKTAAADQRSTLTAAIACSRRVGASPPTSSAGSRRRSAPRS